MNKGKKPLRTFMFCIVIVSHSFAALFCQPGSFKNVWKESPCNIPNNASIDAPLMGNGNITMSVGYKGNCLRYYLSKNDFWRLRSQADNLSGPRVAGFLDIMPVSMLSKISLMVPPHAGCRQVNNQGWKQHHGFQRLKTL
jgi:hypothetical protein